MEQSKAQAPQGGPGGRVARWITGKRLEWRAPLGTVVVPTEVPWRPGDPEPRLRVGQDAEGTPAGLAYSTPKALAEAWSEQQPWIAVDRDELLQALRALGVGHILIDGVPFGAPPLGAEP